MGVYVVCRVLRAPPGLKKDMDFTGQVRKRVWKLTFFLVWKKVRIWRTGRTPPPRIPRSTTRDPGPTMKNFFCCTDPLFYFRYLIQVTESKSEKVLHGPALHPASRAFISLAQFWRTRERICLNRVRCLLSMRGMLLGYSFEPPGGSLRISSDRDDQRISWVWYFRFRDFFG